MSIAGNFDKAGEPECPEVAEIGNIQGFNDMLNYVARTSRAIENEAARSHFSRILERMKELKIAPEDQEVIVATFSGQGSCGRNLLAQLAADYMAGRVSSEGAVAAWRAEAGLPPGPPRALSY